MKYYYSERNEPALVLALTPVSFLRTVLQQITSHSMFWSEEEKDLSRSIVTTEKIA